MSFIIGVDIGGTFTDCYVINEKGSVAYDKAPSTPHNFSLGVLESVKTVCTKLNKPVGKLLQEASLFVHACTVATNTIINHSGARTGLITTRGVSNFNTCLSPIGPTFNIKSINGAMFKASHLYAN